MNGLIVDIAVRENEMWEGLVTAFARIMGKAREPEDQARQLATYLRINYDVALRPETRVK